MENKPNFILLQGSVLYIVMEGAEQKIAPMKAPVVAKLKKPRRLI